MKIYYVTFAGHRKVEDFLYVEQKVYKVIENLLKKEKHIVFYIGNDGEFDTMAMSCIRRLLKKLGEENCTVNLVLPYKKGNIDYYEKQFDSVIIPAELYGIYYKRAITERNKWMVDHSELLICYVNKPNGGAAKMLSYAKKRK